MKVAALAYLAGIWAYQEGVFEAFRYGKPFTKYMQRSCQVVGVGAFRMRNLEYEKYPKQQTNFAVSIDMTSHGN